MIGLITTLPDTVILEIVRRPTTNAPYRNSRSWLNVENKILNEGDLINSPDYAKTRGGHLSKSKEVKRNSVDLEVSPFKVTNNSPASSGVEFSMQGRSWQLSLFEILHLVSLGHIAFQYSSHKAHNTLKHVIYLLKYLF